MNSEQHEKLVDEEQLNMLKSLFAERFPDFLESFYKDFEKKEQELQLALDDKHLDAVAKIAHTLRGSSSNLGATGIANVCHALETFSKAGNLQETKAANTHLQALYPLVKAEVVRISQIQ